MRRPALTWAVFGLCLVVVLVGLAWVTRLALRLDAAHVEAQGQAVLEEKVRLALWRMDSAVGPVIAQENARPYFHYSPFYPAERAYPRMFSAISPGEVLIPSPALLTETRHVLLYFQSDGSGNLTSPQVPTGQMERLARSLSIGHEVTARYAARLDEFRRLAPGQSLVARLETKEPGRPVSVRAAEAPVKKSSPAQPADDRIRQKALEQQAELSAKEYQVRASNQAQLNLDLKQQSLPPPEALFRPPAAEVSRENQAVGAAAPLSTVGESSMAAFWQGNLLLLARPVWVNGSRYVQGCWLDWPSLRKDLLQSIGDLLPQAELEPLETADREAAGRALAALPVRLVPGRLPLQAPAGSLVKTSLGVVWVCVVAAGIAAALLLRQALSLSERRGAFVSAVTHELRTPLTTFRMYTEMLAEGMTRNESERQEFIGTLRTEAERLDHLVKNVLSYARLEANRSHAAVQDLSLAALLDSCQARLRQRTEQARMTLDIDLPDSDRLLVVRTDASIVEQILFNLVDNAAKYASAAEDRRIVIEVQARKKQAILSVRDHGPGVSADVRHRLFRPFSKSAVEAAHSAPGVGLGLALSRRLARSLGGDLKLDVSVRDGACFRLSLPLSRR